MKSISWEQPEKPPVSKFSAVVAQQEVRRKAFEAEQAFLQKAHAPLKALLQTRMENNTPLRIMRPLTYQTSGLPDEIEDDGFYSIKKSETSVPKFIDKMVTIPRGESIILKSLCPPLQEFVFQDTRGNEHPISFGDVKLLMLQTDIYETVRDFMDSQPG